jgi:hypothetical protein
MAQTREKVRKLAEREGRQLQALVEEALTDLLDKRAQSKPRASVMTVYESSIERFGRCTKN